MGKFQVSFSCQENSLLLNLWTLPGPPPSGLRALGPQSQACDSHGCVCATCSYGAARLSSNGHGEERIPGHGSGPLPQRSFPSSAPAGVRASQPQPTRATVLLLTEAGFLRPRCSCSRCLGRPTRRERPAPPRPVRGAPRGACGPGCLPPRRPCGLPDGVGGSLHRSASSSSVGGSETLRLTHTSQDAQTSRSVQPERVFFP